MTQRKLPSCARHLLLIGKTPQPSKTSHEPQNDKENKLLSFLYAFVRHTLRKQHTRPHCSRCSSLTKKPGVRRLLWKLTFPRTDNSDHLTMHTLLCWLPLPLLSPSACSNMRSELGFSLHRPLPCKLRRLDAHSRSHRAAILVTFVDLRKRRSPSTSTCRRRGPPRVAGLLREYVVDT